MAMTPQQLQAAIDALIQGIAEGVQQIRFSDGSGITYVDAAQAPVRLQILRGELASIQGLPVRRTMRFIPTRTIREW